MVGVVGGHASVHSSSYATSTAHSVALTAARGGVHSSSQQQTETTQHVQQPPVKKFPDWFVAGWCVAMLIVLVYLLHCFVTEEKK